MNTMIDRNRVHDFEIKQSSTHGEGVFTRTAYPKGALVLSYYKYGRMNQKRDRHSIEFRILTEDTGKVITLHIYHDVAAFLNHSLTPNLTADPFTGEMRATKDIPKGQELTFNYNDTESQFAEFFDDLTD